MCTNVFPMASRGWWQLATTTVNGDDADEAMNGDDAMSLAQQKLRLHLVKKRAFLKVRAALILLNRKNKFSDLTQIQSKSSLCGEPKEIEEIVSGDNANADYVVETNGGVAPMPVEDGPHGDDESDYSLPPEIGGDATNIREWNTEVQPSDSQSTDSVNVTTNSG